MILSGKATPTINDLPIPMRTGIEVIDRITALAAQLRLMLGETVIHYAGDKDVYEEFVEYMCMMDLLQQGMADLRRNEIQRKFKLAFDTGLLT